MSAKYIMALTEVTDFTKLLFFVGNVHPAECISLKIHENLVSVKVVPKTIDDRCYHVACERWPLP